MQSNLYRFRGVRALYGEEAFKNFQKSHVLIVGTGGVGSWAIECLVRTGIGEITIIDNDIIDEGNSNRQLHTLVSTYGQTKASVMKNRMLDINPDLKISIKEVFLTPENIGNLIKRAFEISERKYYNFRYTRPIKRGSIYVSGK